MLCLRGFKLYSRWVPDFGTSVLCPCSKGVHLTGSQRKAKTNSRSPLQRGVSYERVDCNSKQFYFAKFLSAHSPGSYNLSLTSVICRERDCKSLFKMSSHFERSNQNDRYKLGAQKTYM